MRGMANATLSAALLGLLLVLSFPQPAGAAANCTRTSTGLTAIPDLAGGTYKGARGGLYPDGTNDAPAPYATGGERAARAIVPRDAQGRADPNGKIVLLSIGMSNTTIEYSAFVTLAAKDPRHDAHVAVVDGAIGGQDAAAWADPNARTWSIVEDRLRQAGVTEAQVQAVWLKQAQARPNSDFQTYTTSLAGQMRTIVDIASRRYPNVQQVFVSPRTYAGYATTDLNPEPYAYETGFADKLLVTDSVAHPDARPWIGWGPYLWTDGTRGRGDGFVWTCQDVRDSDGTHPSVPQGQMKVGAALQAFFDGSPFATWYRGVSPVVPANASATPSLTAVPSASAIPVGGIDSDNADAESSDVQAPMTTRRAWLLMGLVGLGLLGAAAFVARGR